MKYISALISGVAIFCVGTGFSFYHGISGLMSSEPSGEYMWAYIVLTGSLIFEAVTLMLAIRSIISSAKATDVTFLEYVQSGQDPCVNVVLFEDSAAVAGAAVAALCIALTAYTGSTIPDSIGSLLIGCMLGGVASLIIYTSVPALVGRSINRAQLNLINAELENDTMIKSIHDVKGIDMGNSMVRYKVRFIFTTIDLIIVYKYVMYRC